MSKYVSCFATQINDFVNFRIASRRWCEHSYGDYLRAFDRFCAEKYPSEQKLTQKMIDEWCQKRNSENSNSFRNRIYVVYDLAIYLRDRNIVEIVPPAIPRALPSTYVPHAFSEDELQQFFNACDHLPVTQDNFFSKIRSFTVPVFFRLLFSTGIRTCEARELHVEDVDLKHGVLTIRHSKGRDQHYIVLHDSMTDLMRRYDKAIRQYYPQRAFFFSSHRNRPYTSSWVKMNFRIIWDSFSGKKDAVAYAFRHNYATTNINKWVGEGLKFEDKLTYLSKSMGHMSIDSTTYYYSIVPCLADILSSKTENGFNEIVPEVLYEE